MSDRTLVMENVRSMLAAQLEMLLSPDHELKRSFIKRTSEDGDEVVGFVNEHDDHELRNGIDIEKIREEGEAHFDEGVDHTSPSGAFALDARSYRGPSTQAMGAVQEGVLTRQAVSSVAADQADVSPGALRTVVEGYVDRAADLREADGGLRVNDAGRVESDASHLDEFVICSSAFDLVFHAYQIADGEPVDDVDAWIGEGGTTITFTLDGEAESTTVGVHLPDADDESVGLDVASQGADSRADVVDEWTRNLLQSDVGALENLFETLAGLRPKARLTSDDARSIYNSLKNAPDEFFDDPLHRTVPTFSIPHFVGMVHDHVRHGGHELAKLERASVRPELVQSPEVVVARAWLVPDEGSEDRPMTVMLPLEIPDRDASPALDGGFGTLSECFSGARDEEREVDMLDALAVAFEDYDRLVDGLNAEGETMATSVTAANLLPSIQVSDLVYRTAYQGESVLGVDRDPTAASPMSAIEVDEVLDARDEPIDRPVLGGMPPPGVGFVTSLPSPRGSGTWEHELTSVQPMSQPVGAVFYFDYEDEMLESVPWHRQVAGHMKHGAATAAVDEASEMVLNLAREGLYGVDPVRDALEEPIVRELSKLGAGLAAHQAAARHPESVPRPAAVRRAAGLVVENATRELTAGALDEIRAKLEHVAAVADEIDEGDEPAGLPAAEFEDDVECADERDPVVVGEGASLDE